MFLPSNWLVTSKDKDDENSNQYEQDIKATTQVYDPSLGSRSNEVSGVAQRTRIAQGQTGNFTFANNFRVPWIVSITASLAPPVHSTVAGRRPVSRSRAR